MTTTKVIIRESCGVIVALFPEVAGACDPNKCLMITETGKKMAVVPEDFMRSSEAVSPENVTLMKEKLIVMGYEPKVISRPARDSFDKRFNSAAF